MKWAEINDLIRVKEQAEKLVENRDLTINIFDLENHTDKLLQSSTCYILAAFAAFTGALINAQFCRPIDKLTACYTAISWYIEKGEFFIFKAFDEDISNY